MKYLHKIFKSVLNLQRQLGEAKLDHFSNNLEEIHNELTTLIDNQNYQGSAADEKQFRSYQRIFYMLAHCFLSLKENKFSHQKEVLLKIIFTSLGFLLYSLPVTANFNELNFNIFGFRYDKLQSNKRIMLIHTIENARLVESRIIDLGEVIISLNCHLNVSYFFFIEILLNFFQNPVFNWTKLIESNYELDLFIKSLKNPFMQEKNRILKEDNIARESIVNNLSFFVPTDIRGLVLNYILPPHNQVQEFFDSPK